MILGDCVQAWHQLTVNYPSSARSRGVVKVLQINTIPPKLLKTVTDHELNDSSKQLDLPLSLVITRSALNLNVLEVEVVNKMQFVPAMQQARTEGTVETKQVMPLGYASSAVPQVLPTEI